MAKRRSGIDGMAELGRTFRELGKVPQTVATQAARAGGSVAYKAAKSNAPVDTGALKSGIIMKRERRTQPGKAVYDVEMDPAMNDVFVKNHMAGKHHSTVRAGKTVPRFDKVRSYYPASQEYGFLTIDGRYIPGYHFLRRAITENAPVIEKAILDATGKAVDKALRKG